MKISRFLGMLSFRGEIKNVYEIIMPCLCLRECVFILTLNQMTDLHETRYECYETGDHQMQYLKKLYCQ
jgi:hypothetical protein